MATAKSKITALPEDLHQPVTQFMAGVIKAFTDCKAAQVVKLTHKGQEKASAKSDREFTQGLMNGGDRVVAWHAKKYRQPNWDVMSYLDFYPKPTVWIDVTLHDGNREYPYVFALAPASDNRLLRCYYVDRED